MSAMSERAAVIDQLIADLPAEDLKALADSLASQVGYVLEPEPAHPDGPAQGPGPGEAVEKGNHDCLAKRRPGEPMFILLGRDPDAHNIVRMWAERRLSAGGDPEHCQMGLDTAERMRAYAADPANAPASAPRAEAYPGHGEAVAYRSRQRNFASSGKPGPWNYWDGTEVAPTSDSVYEAEALGVIAATPTREPDHERP